jgi:hypothetical protein
MNDKSENAKQSKAETVGAIETMLAWTNRACRMMEFYRSLLPTIADKHKGDHESLLRYDMEVLGMFVQCACAAMHEGWARAGDKVSEFVGLWLRSYESSDGHDETACKEAARLLNDGIDCLLEARECADGLPYITEYDAQNLMARSGTTLNHLHCAAGCMERAHTTLTAGL